MTIFDPHFPSLFINCDAELNRPHDAFGSLSHGLSSQSTNLNGFYSFKKKAKKENYRMVFRCFDFLIKMHSATRELGVNGLGIVSGTYTILLVSYDSYLSYRPRVILIVRALIMIMKGAWRMELRAPTGTSPCRTSSETHPRVLTLIFIYKKLPL